MRAIASDPADSFIHLVDRASTPGRTLCEQLADPKANPALAFTYTDSAMAKVASCPACLRNNPPPLSAAQAEEWGHFVQFGGTVPDDFPRVAGVEVPDYDAALVRALASVSVLRADADRLIAMAGESGGDRERE